MGGRHYCAPLRESYSATCLMRRVLDWRSHECGELLSGELAHTLVLDILFALLIYDKLKKKDFWPQ